VNGSLRVTDVSFLVENDEPDFLGMVLTAVFYAVKFRNSALHGSLGFFSIVTPVEAANFVSKALKE
jgi:hypothetical protein